MDESWGIKVSLNSWWMLKRVFWWRSQFKQKIVSTFSSKLSSSLAKHSLTAILLSHSITSGALFISIQKLNSLGSVSKRTLLRFRPWFSSESWLKIAIEEGLGSLVELTSKTVAFLILMVHYFGYVVVSSFLQMGWWNRSKQHLLERTFSLFFSFFTKIWNKLNLSRIAAFDGRYKSFFIFETLSTQEISIQCASLGPCNDRISSTFALASRYFWWLSFFGLPTPRAIVTNLHLFKLN